MFSANLELTNYKYVHVLRGDSQIWLCLRKTSAFSLITCNPNFEVAGSEFLFSRSVMEPDSEIILKTVFCELHFHHVIFHKYSQNIRFIRY